MRQRARCCPYPSSPRLDHCLCAGPCRVVSSLPWRRVYALLLSSSGCRRRVLGLRSRNVLLCCNCAHVLSAPKPFRVRCTRCCARWLLSVNATPHSRQLTPISSPSPRGPSFISSYAVWDASVVKGTPQGLTSWILYTLGPALFYAVIARGIYMFHYRCATQIRTAPCIARACSTWCVDLRWWRRCG